MATYLEHQVQAVGNNFKMTVTITALGNHWTSSPVLLEATTWKDAMFEAEAQVDALRLSLAGGDTA